MECQPEFTRPPKNFARIYLFIKEHFSTDYSVDAQLYHQTSIVRTGYQRNLLHRYFNIF